MWLALAGAALAHDFATITLGPSPTWCADLHEQAGPGDVVTLLAGAYRGGCELSVGGFPELNEAFLLSPFGNGPVVIEPDADGLSLRVTGEPTRLYSLTFGGRVEIAAENVTIDTSDAVAVDIAPGVRRVTVLWSRLGALGFSGEHAVVRGNVLDALDVTATTGLIADNAVFGDASTNLPFRRNLVLGDLAAVDAWANVIVGHADVAGRLYGNTLLDSATAGDPRNNLATVAVLDASAGNLVCPDCFADVESLDVRPSGAALVAVPVDAPDDPLDFCSQPHDTIGAVGPIEGLEGQFWTALDRTREGCVAGLPPGAEVEPPTPPPTEPEPAPEALDPVSEPDTPVVSAGCATFTGPVWFPLSWMMRWRS